MIPDVCEQLKKGVIPNLRIDFSLLIELVMACVYWDIIDQLFPFNIIITGECCEY